MRPSSTRRSRPLTSLRTAVAAAAVAAAALAGPAATADQTAPELEGLFSALSTSTDPHEAIKIEFQVWKHWLQHPDSQAQDTMTRGIRSMQAGDYQRALVTFDDLVERNPKFAEAWNKRATVHYLLGNDEA